MDMQEHDASKQTNAITKTSKQMNKAKLNCHAPVWQSAQDLSKDS